VQILILGEINSSFTITLFLLITWCAAQATIAKMKYLEESEIFRLMTRYMFLATIFEVNLNVRCGQTPFSYVSRPAASANHGLLRWKESEREPIRQRNLLGSGRNTLIHCAYGLSGLVFYMTLGTTSVKWPWCTFGAILPCSCRHVNN